MGQDVTQKESKDSSAEGAKDKSTKTAECPTVVSEASVDKSNKESEDVKPSTPSQPDVHKAIERADEVTLQELEKKQISQDELPSKLEQDATSKSKLSMEQQELVTAESSVAVDLKSPSDQQKLVTSDSSINGEHVSATDQRELVVDKNLQSKEDLSKPTPTDISQQKSEEVSKPISQQSPSEETINSEALAIQQAEKEFKSAVKTIKEESEKVVPDKSVKPKT